MGKRARWTTVALVFGLGLMLLVTACGTPALTNLIHYQGRLTDSGGNSVNGSRNMTFRLYVEETGGSSIWSETQNSVPVTNGLFNVALGANTALEEADFHQPLWLEIVVAGQTLSGRQPLYGAPYAFSLVPGAVLKGYVDTTDTYSSTLNIANFGTGQGLAVWTLGGTSAYVEGGGQGRYNAALRVFNRNATQGMAAYIVNQSDYATAHFDNSGSGQVLYLTNGGTNSAGTGGGDFIRALNHPSSDLQFRVSTTGEVRSDAGFFTPAADMAEMLPSVKGLEPGDTLVVGADGRLLRSTSAYQPTVVGVYSTRPGFVGGQPTEGELVGYVPLAVSGIVPVKATDENGAIRPGDLLTTSSTPGRAMRATLDKPGTILGKALSPMTNEEGVLDVLIMLR